MRLARVEREHSIKHRLILKAMRLASGLEPPDVVKLLFYRPDFLGARVGKHTQATLRGPSEWSVGERELFAAFVARLSQCPF